MILANIHLNHHNQLHNQDHTHQERYNPLGMNSNLHHHYIRHHHILGHHHQDSYILSNPMSS